MGYFPAFTLWRNLMGVILCATRGGEASFRTQTEAIALAKSRGDELAFLYVVDLNFLDKTAAPIVIDIENEISQMGTFLLLVAKERAIEQGVSARTLSSKGNVRDEIKKAALKIGATMVVLGHPAGETSAFKSSSLKSFADEIELETGAEVKIV
jgi:nucleotide-binding universal stress UspA family protein